jgi:hypothetical protein
VRKRTLVTISAALAAGFCALSPFSAQAQSYKADDIIKHFGAAKPNLGVSRGLCVGTEAECNKAGHAVKPVGAFDLVVKFKYNSDVLEPEAKLNLDEFAKALKDPNLSASSFLVEGHTDARGSADYNLNLSERRARAASTRPSSFPAAMDRASRWSPTSSRATTGGSRPGCRSSDALARLRPRRFRPTVRGHGRAQFR